jgi:hypothetical protein
MTPEQPETLALLHRVVERWGRELGLMDLLDRLPR